MKTMLIKRAPGAIFLVLGAVIGAVGIVAAVRDLGVGSRVLPAVGAGAVAYGLLKVRGGSLGWSDVLNVTLSVACALLATWAFTDSDSPKAAGTSSGRHVRLLAPPRGFTFSGDHVSGVRGTVSGLRQGETLWLMVQAAGDDRPYLMSTPCSIDNAGRFRCPPAYTGLPRYTRHRFRVLVRIFDSPTTDQVIGDWEKVLTEGERSLSYGGLLGRPGASVAVYRAA